MRINDAQVIGATAAIVVFLGLATLAAQFRWLRDGSWLQRILFFLDGVSIIVIRRSSGVPPSWFDGSKIGFGLAVTFLAGAFIGRGAREFRLPLFTAMGSTLLVLNVLPHL